MGRVREAPSLSLAMILWRRCRSVTGLDCLQNNLLNRMQNDYVFERFLFETEWLQPDTDGKINANDMVGEDAASGCHELAKGHALERGRLFGPA